MLIIVVREQEVNDGDEGGEDDDYDYVVMINT